MHDNNTLLQISSQEILGLFYTSTEGRTGYELYEDYRFKSVQSFPLSVTLNSILTSVGINFPICKLEIFAVIIY